MRRRVNLISRERIIGVAVVSIIAASLISRPPSVSAEQLPFRHYGVYEGLPHSTVQCLFQDSRGYLWIGTADGLARFDGYGFTRYDTGDGLGHSFINAIAEDRKGRVWIATNGGGVSCFIDQVPKSLTAGDVAAGAARRKFSSFKISDQRESNRVNGLLFDASDRLWCPTDAGLFRASVPSSNVEELEFEVVVPHAPVALAMGAFADRRGRLWFGNANMIVEAVGDRIITYGSGNEFGSEVRFFAEDLHGRLLAATNTTLLEFQEPQDTAGPGAWKAAPIPIASYAPQQHKAQRNQ